MLKLSMQAFLFALMLSSACGPIAMVQSADELDARGLASAATSTHRATLEGLRARLRQVAAGKDAASPENRRLQEILSGAVGDAENTDRIRERISQLVIEKADVPTRIDRWACGAGRSYR